MISDYGQVSLISFIIYRPFSRGAITFIHPVVKIDPADSSSVIPTHH